MGVTLTCGVYDKTKTQKIPLLDDLIGSKIVIYSKNRLKQMKTEYSEKSLNNSTTYNNRIHWDAILCHSEHFLYFHQLHILSAVQ